MKKLIFKRAAAPELPLVKHPAELQGSPSIVARKLPTKKPWILEVARPPHTTKPLKIMGFSKELLDCPLDNIICGLVLTREGDDAVTAWLCRNVAHDPYTRVTSMGVGTRRKIVNGPKPYFKLLGEFRKQSKKETGHHAYCRALEAMCDAYEELHDINFYSLELECRAWVYDDQA